jgi:sigma-B regulation protein RsbU (phosphoserine phosphatase)
MKTGVASREPGDLLLCYTDGITEVANTGGQMLGTEGLGTLLKEGFLGTSGRVLDRLRERVLERCATVSLSDDVLLLSVQRTNAED